ncbi:MAG: endonuclease III domain-containing protein [Methanobacteriota archaeon]
MIPKPKRVPSPTSLYERLRARYGPQDWWPRTESGPDGRVVRTKGADPWEVVVGAILTQNTSWTNVEKAILGLKTENLWEIETIAAAPVRKIAAAIRSSGYYNQKAKRLQGVARHVLSRHGSLERMLSQETGPLRDELLSLHGVGPETADSFLLYAAGRPVFVVDAYTKRLAARMRWRAGDSYDSLQRSFIRALPSDAALFSEYHALIVAHAKAVCRKTPLCTRCFLVDRCPSSGKKVGGRAGSGKMT